MIIVRIFCIFSLLISSVVYSSCLEEEFPITADDRIKTYIYNPSEVFLLVLHPGFQSSIEFAKNEEIRSIFLGDSYAWEVVYPLPNRIFIKALEKNVRTNMTIITNKRTYEFDIVSKELEVGHEHELVYLIRFYYPQKKARN
ncbi:conjugal transfer family protein [Orientia chuto str. Dubai]|uniref:Conjugal transfer family protein n=1 Tax=Orientia chuto str. Dubai TaxID=1359168 RepID=A0A0F3MHS6_9RICK|nr:TrbG/VirB9 family P-type conjugative transfer protein [Candidatus Orientia mediorientalis]KJV55206.1 conjugal transfer family protein [Orientia chuto str. Dubai]